MVKKDFQKRQVPLAIQEAVIKDIILHRCMGSAIMNKNRKFFEGALKNMEEHRHEMIEVYEADDITTEGHYLNVCNMIMGDRNEINEKEQILDEINYWEDEEE